MNKLRRWIHKDRYGIVRSSIILCVLFAACVFAFGGAQERRLIEFEKERSATAASQASAALEQMINDGIAKLQGAANMILEGRIDENQMLNGLIEYGKFSNAAIQRNDMLYFSDGSSEASGNLSYYASNSDLGKLVFFANDRNTIRMSARIDAGEQLIVWLDAERIQEVFYNLFPQAYDYALFNFETGSFLLNATAFDTDSYYDALLHMNADGSVEELFHAATAQVRVQKSDAVYLIAQQQTALSPWGIVMMIPEALLQSKAAYERQDMLLAVAVLVLLIGAVALNDVIALRRIRISNQNTARAFAANDLLMQVSVRDSGATVIMYNRMLDRVLSCYDGLCLQNGDQRLVSLNSLADCCGLEANELDQLCDCIHKLMPGEISEIILHGNSIDHEMRALRCILHACDDDSKNVIFVISDATQQQAFVTRADIEKDYMASVRMKVSSIWQVNISRNRWRLISSGKDSPFAMQIGVWSDYTDDMRSKVRKYIHPADYTECYEKMLDIDALGEDFRMGKTEFSCEYRMYGKRMDEYEWNRMQVRLWLDVRTNNILANLYVFDVNAKKNAELERGERKRIFQQAVTALGGMYFGLYYVDLENDLSYTARSLGGELVDQLCLPYKASFDEYIDRAVHPEDREALRHLLSAYALRCSMKEGSHFRHGEYRRKVGDEDYAWSSIIVQPARFENGSVKEVVLAIRDIDRKNDFERI